jgi:bleomycin hydrolase
MKKIVTVILFLAVVAGVSAQDAYFPGVTISEDVLQKMRNNFEQTPGNTALINAVTNNDIKKLALNRENEGKVNHFFTNVVETKGITNQNKSGRCWLYTGLNTMRPLVNEKYELNDFEFSQTYNFFWDQLEKANLFYEAVMATASLPMDDREVEWLFKNPIGDGGQWTTFSDNVQKYGLVPASAMPDTYQSKNTRTMSQLLNRKLREDGISLRGVAMTMANEKIKKNAKIEYLSEVYRILVLSLGEPPQSFTWQFENKDGKLSEPKTYTPKEFYDEVVGVNLDDFVMLMNDPTKEYYKLYEVKYDRNLFEGNNWKFINLPIEDVKKFAKSSILANEAMYFSCDVGKQLNVETGTLDLNNYDYDALMGVKFGMDKKQRIESFESGSTHGMALVGVNILADGSVDKWLLENSWGADKGNKGFLTMTDAWFTEFMFRLVVNKKHIDSKTLQVLDSEAIQLPPWDPVFAMEE